MGDLLSRRTAIRRAEVLSVSGEEGRVELRLLDGPLAGERSAGIFYEELGDGPDVGEVVLANTVGVEMDLGTGGVCIVLPGAGGEVPANEDHLIKLPYTPLQFPAKAAGRTGNLRGKPVAVLALHSHLAVACCAAARFSPGVRTAFVWQEGGALAVGLSQTVEKLKQKGLLHAVVSSGSCFGGDMEAVNLYSGLLAAAGSADLVFVGIGPGVVGTGEPYGHGGMSAALALNAASSLGARPVLAPRVSEADARERHRGLSHHTRSALEAALAGCRVALPPQARVYLDNLPERHEYVVVEESAAGLEEEFGLTFASMGRSYGEDPVFFDAPAAAVRLALSDEEDV